MVKYLAMRKQINIARGKPCKEQLDLSNPMFEDIDYSFLSEENVDVRNYGAIEGLKETRRLFADLLDVNIENVVIGDCSSLNLMFDCITRSYTHGVNGSTPWCKLKKVKWICPVPGYDRHFKILEHYDIEMISIPLNDDGPDMDIVEELVKDPAVKGIWCVPKYSNPTGIIYSDEVINRLARLRPAAPDFRIYYDNAYFVHDLYEEIKIPNILALAEQNGNPNLVYEFISTSKITFSGSGLSAFISSEHNVKEFLKFLAIQTIGYNKITQYLHSKYFKSVEDVRKHMQKHAEIIRPKFELVNKVLEEKLTGYASWSKPKGGYFVVLYVDNLAKEVVEECKNRGLVLTDAGCAHPYHKDPNNSLIRIAPTYIDIEELKEALDILVDVILSLKK